MDTGTKIMFGAIALGAAGLFFVNGGYGDTSSQTASVSSALSSSQCHASYEGECLLPDASDYDCKGGSGNGPYYTAKVKVVGPDTFGLDRDKDGWGCE